ncbi:hypothetical protein GCM10025298_25090 [Natronobiforma cellulositropha]
MAHLEERALDPVAFGLFFDTRTRLPRHQEESDTRNGDHTDQEDEPEYRSLAATVSSSYPPTPPRSHVQYSV